MEFVGPVTGVVALVVSVGTLWWTWLRGRRAHLALTVHSRAVTLAGKDRLEVRNFGPGTAREIKVRLMTSRDVQLVEVPILAPEESFFAVVFPVEESTDPSPAELEWRDGRRAKQSRDAVVSIN